MFLIEYSSTRTAKEAWVIQRIGIVRDHKMILKILASDNPPDQHVQGLLNGAAFQNHQDYLRSTAVPRLTKQGGHVDDLRTYLFHGS